jgi:hypothetical protein
MWLQAQRICCTDEALLSTNYSQTFGKSFTRTNPSWLVNVSVWSAVCTENLDSDVAVMKSTKDAA